MPNQICLAEALAAVGERHPSQRALERATVLAREWLASDDPRAGEWLEEIEAARSAGWAR